MTSQKNPPCKFLIQWVLANTAGMLVGGNVGMLALLSAGLFKDFNVPFFLFGILLGSCLGTAQVMVLKDRIDQKAKWIIPCAITGGAFMWMIFFACDQYGSILMSRKTLTATGVVSLTALVCGLVQWLELRKKHTHAVWWIPLYTLAWGGAIPVFFWGLSLEVLGMYALLLILILTMWVLPGIYLAYLPCKSVSLPQQFEIDQAGE